MKLRNKVLALACLLAFIGFGVLFFRTWVIQKPFGIVLFISDGMTASCLTAARQFEGGADHKLTLQSFSRLALVSNHANDFAVPDSAAASSALSTGAKVNNRSIAIAPDGQPLQTLVELARAAGRAVGIVTTGEIANPGLAPFYAHGSGEESETIAAQLADHTVIDVGFGGGRDLFLPESKGGSRDDGRDLLGELRNRGVEIVTSRAELDGAAAFRTTPILGLFDDQELGSTSSAREQQPSLADMVRRAVEMLQYNRRGYLLIVDTALITQAAEQNDGEKMLTEILALDHAVATALNYAGEKALILCVGKHAIGGMTLNGFPLRWDYGVGLLGKNAFGYPAITWSTGPNGIPPGLLTAVAAQAELQQSTTKSDELKLSDDVGDAAALPMLLLSRPEPAAFYIPAAIPTAGDMLAVATGPGSEEVHGFLDNTDIFRIIKDKL
jgi:alkaline phosphatase